MVSMRKLRSRTFLHDKSPQKAEVPVGLISTKVSKVRYPVITLISANVRCWQELPLADLNRSVRKLRSASEGKADHIQIRLDD